jgi:hypothetical protein
MRHTCTRYALLVLFSLVISALSAQVGIGTVNANPSAILDMTSTSKGVLVPRMTAAQRTAVSSPATGLMVYQTDGATGFYFNAGTSASPSWAPILSVSPGASGNVLTSDGTAWVSQASAGGGSGTVSTGSMTTLGTPITINQANTITDITTFTVSRPTLANIRVQFGETSGARVLLVTDNNNNQIASTNISLSTVSGNNGLLGLSVFLDAAGTYKIRVSSAVQPSVISSYSVSKIEFN